MTDTPTPFPCRRPGMMISSQPEAEPAPPDVGGRRKLDLSKRVPWKRSVTSVPPPLDMVVPGLQSGKVGVIGGAGASSKTMLALQTAISVAAGHDLFNIFDGATIAPGRVVYLSLEDDKHALWIREHAIGHEIEGLVRSGMVLDELRVVSPETIEARLEELHDRVDSNLEVIDIYGQGLAFAMKDGGRIVACDDDIEQLLPSLQGARLVIVDTLNRAASAGSLDENSAGDMGALLVALERICAGVGCALIVLHHINKGGLSDGEAESLTQEILRGSSVIVDNARWVLMLRVMNEAQAKARYGDAWEDEKSFWVRREIVKQNHGKPIAGTWIRRVAGGVLSAFAVPPPKRAGGNGSGSSRKKAQE